jgi:hypothetical protein
MDVELDQRGWRQRAILRTGRRSCRHRVEEQHVQPGRSDAGQRHQVSAVGLQHANPTSPTDWGYTINLVVTKGNFTATLSYDPDVENESPNTALGAP